MRVSDEKIEAYLENNGGNGFYPERFVRELLEDLKDARHEIIELTVIIGALKKKFGKVKVDSVIAGIFE